MSYKRVFLKVGRLLGVQQSSGGHLEKIISGVGGVVGIVAVILVSQDFLGTNGSPLIIASLGASAVLLFAVPHGPLSQPWAVLGGHTLSAVIGVTCAELPGDKYIAAALAVGLSIAVMHYCRCIHPPGGATALTAVIGGDAIQGLGYQYVVTPVLTSACVILAVAVLVNLPFSARRYPIALGQWLGEREANKRKR